MWHPLFRLNVIHKYKEVLDFTDGSGDGVGGGGEIGGGGSQGRLPRLSHAFLAPTHDADLVDTP